MAVIYSADFIDLGTITSRTEASGYSDDNVADKWRLKRRFRAGDNNTNDWLLKFNLGSAKSVAAIVLLDVNFDTVQFQGHASDSWGAPSYESSELTVSQNKLTGRYNIYATIGETYQWWRIFIPSGASAVGSYTSKWEVGTVAILDSATEFTRNISYGYTRSAEDAIKEIKLPHGGVEAVDIGGGVLKWIGEFEWENIQETNEDEVWALGRQGRAAPLIWYENDGDTSQVYCCRRATNFTGTIQGYNQRSTSIIRLEELI